MPNKKKLIIACGAAALTLALGLGYWQWQRSGRLSLDGVLQNTVHALSSEAGGVIASVEVQPGASVRQGAVLVRFDDSAARKELDAERNKLGQLLLLLPPHRIPASAVGVQGGPDGETLTARLERLRTQEEDLQKYVHDASGKEAQAAIYYNRVTAQAASGRLSEQDVAAAAGVLETARASLVGAKKNFESVSLDRAATGADIQRLKEIQAALGADQLPEGVRIKNYWDQKQWVATLENTHRATAITAPEDGKIVDVKVQSGMTVAPMQPCLYLRSSGSGAVIRALAPGADIRKLKAGQQCLVTLEDHDGTFDGFVSGISPGLPMADSKGEALAAVWITLTPTVDNEQDLLMLPDGAKAKVAVLLRAALKKMPSSANALPVQVKQSSAAKSNAASANPQSVGAAPGVSAPSTQGGNAPSMQGSGAPAASGSSAMAAPGGSVEATGMSATTVTGSPAGNIGAASSENSGAAVQQGSVSQSSGTPPVLPPMKAPKKLTGSPYPNPKNNPSLVAPQMREQDRFGRP